MSALAIQDLSAGYGSTAVIHGIALEVAAGEFVGVIGPNGAGKSTTIKAVTGVASVLGGTVRVEGETADGMGARSLARKVAVVPQSPPETFSFSGREFVEMGRYPYLGRFDRLRTEDHSAVERALALTDTASLAQSPVDTLSGGDLQRLTLAQALAQEPSVLLLDEPTSHLDLNHQLQVLDLVRLRTAEGLAVLGVFHDIGLAARYADRLAVIADGRLRALGRPHDVVTSELLHEVFGVRAVVGTDPVTGTVSVTPVLRDEGRASALRERVFVLAGSGAGAAVMRDLVQAGYDVVAGALNEGDIDQAVADALGIAHVKLPPFGDMNETAESQIRSLIAESSVAVVSEVPFGGANVGNLRAVTEGPAPVVLIGSPDDRDFTRGQATHLLNKLVADGAVRVERVADVLGAVEAVVSARGKR